MRIALITGVYGSYDPVRRLPEGHGFDEALCVTDDESIDAPGWHVTAKSAAMPPRMACKYPKMLPWAFTDCDAAVWLDASFSVVGDLRSFVEPQLEAQDFIVFRHPERRDCLVQEMEVCWSWKKYRDYPLRAQVRHYLRQGMPEHYGLWAAGMVGWRFTDGAKEFGRRWHAENASWSIQDQVSLPYLLWKTNRIPGEWACHEFQNDFIKYHGHARDD